jgi:hypothetical protein
MYFYVDDAENHFPTPQEVIYGKIGQLNLYQNDIYASSYVKNRLVQIGE